MSGVDVRAVGVLTGWGDGLNALPDDAGRAAGGRLVVRMPSRPRPSGDRFRRATPECLLGIAAVEALLLEAGLEREAIRGAGTALLYVTAGGYGASNRAFVEGAAGGGALYFPYTAPSAVPAEVAIEFGLTGAYLILIGGAVVTIDALWQAALLLRRGVAARALVLAVETFEACEDLWARGRRLLPGPLTEAAVCALLEPGQDDPCYVPIAGAPAEVDEARRRAGETLACEPLIALALARARGAAPVVEGAWRGRRAKLAWPAPPRAS